MSRGARGTSRGPAQSKVSALKSPSELADQLIRIITDEELGEGLKQIPSELIAHASELTEGDLDVVRSSVTLSSSALVALKKCLEQWVGLKEITEKERVWEIFRAEDVSYRALTVWVHALNEAQDESSIHSACVYLALLRLPGNVNIFNPLVLRSSLSLVKLWARANQASQSKSKSKRKASTNSSRVEEDDEEDDEEGGEGGAELFDDDDEEAEAKNNWLTNPKVQDQLIHLIASVSAVMRSVSLAKYPEALAYIGEALIEVTRTSPGSDISASAYEAMHALVNPLHGSTLTSFNLLLKNMLPSVLMTFTKMLPSNVPKSSQTVRAESVDFLISVASGSNTLWFPILVFLQHLSVRSPEKAEYKRAAAKSIVDLCVAFPNVVARLSEFLYRLSFNVKPSFRVVAVDVATEILHQPVLITHTNFELLSSHFPSDLDNSIERKEETPPTPVERKVRAEGEAEAPKHPHPRLLLKVLLDRCSDKGATVRAKALTSFAACLELAVSDSNLSTHFTSLLQAWSDTHGVSAMMSPSEAGSRPEWGVTGSPVRSADRGLFTPLATPLNSRSFHHTPVSSHSINTPRTGTATPVVTTPYQSGLRKISSILSLRSADLRPMVRKAAIQALRAIFLVAGEPVWTVQDLQVFFDGCMDTSLAIRKTSMNALSELLLRYPDDIHLNNVWLGAVFPLVKDPELTAQEEALQQIDTLIFQRVLAALKTKTSASSSASSTSSVSGPDFSVSIWRTLEGLDGEMIQYLQTAIVLMVRRKIFPTNLIKPLNKCIPTATQKGVWILLEELSLRMPGEISSENMILAWNNYQSKHKKSRSNKTEKENRDDTFLFNKILSCMGNVASQLSKNECAALAGFLVDSLADFKLYCSPETGQTMIKTMHLMCAALQEKQSSLPAHERVPMPNWEQELRSACENGLENFLYQQRSKDVPTNDAALVRYLFTLGEIALRSSSEVPKTTITIVQAMLSPFVSSSLGVNDSFSSSTSSTPGSHSSTPASTPSSSSSTSSASSSKKGIAISSEVRAHAYVALGKMCLKKESLAKKIMPLMVAELHENNTNGKSNSNSSSNSGHSVIQNNILIIFCDLARTFTAVVDNYVSSITFCLRSSAELVRKHTLMILAQLLQEDYLKWKNSMFFRFLTSIVDDSKMIRKLGEQCFRSIILLKAPNKFYLHFIETVFFLNKCNKHSVYNQFHTEEDALFAVTSQRRRNVIYNFLLGFMSDTQKFQTAAKLCQDVLGSVVEGSISVADSTVFDVVKDTLLILASKSIKIGRQHAPGGDDGDDAPEQGQQENDQKSESEQKNAAAAAVKGKFLSGLQKKNTLESVVPILIELKRLCERQQSPLLRHLMQYLKELMADYKNELEDVLAADRQLAAELQYDLRQFALQQKAAKNQTELRRLSLTPAHADTIRRVSLTPGIQRSLSHPKLTPSTPAFPRSSPVLATPVSAASGTGKRFTPSSAVATIHLMSPTRAVSEKKWNVEHKSLSGQGNQTKRSDLPLSSNNQSKKNGKRTGETNDTGPTKSSKSQVNTKTSVEPPAKQSSDKKAKRTKKRNKMTKD